MEVLRLGRAPEPVPRRGEILVRVRATALNRADLLQRRGGYPPPPGTTDILGLEPAGEVLEGGRGAGRFSRGDRVFFLLAGGGYAERVAVPAGMAMRIPDPLGFEEAAAIPEAFLAAWRALFLLPRLRGGTTVLVHSAGSGVGTAAVQLAREAGAEVLVTSRSPEKIALCLSLGARAGWNPREGPFAPWAKERTGGRGVDRIVDFVGAPYFAENLASLAPDGTLAVVGLLGGSTAERISLADLLFRRLRIVGTSLRSLPVAEKVRLTRSFARFALPRLADGRLRPVIDSVFDWTRVREAHRRMEENRNAGKIVLRIP